KGFAGVEVDDDVVGCGVEGFPGGADDDAADAEDVEVALPFFGPVVGGDGGVVQAADGPAERKRGEASAERSAVCLIEWGGDAGAEQAGLVEVFVGEVVVVEGADGGFDAD